MAAKTLFALSGTRNNNYLVFTTTTVSPPLSVSLSDTKVVLYQFISSNTEHKLLKERNVLAIFAN